MSFRYIAAMDSPPLEDDYTLPQDSRLWVEWANENATSGERMESGIREEYQRYAG